MQYRLIPFETSPILRSVLFDIYEIKSSDEEVIYTTTPNGILGISLTLSGSSQHKVDHQWSTTPKNAIYGLIKYPDVIKTSLKFHEIAFGFKPFFFQLLTDLSMSEIVAHPNLPLDEAFPQSTVCELEESLHESTDDQQVVLAIERFISQCINDRFFDPKILHAMNLIYTTNVYNVEELSRLINISATALRTHFRYAIGRSPKEVAKIIRFNKLIKSHNPNEKLNFQDIIYQNGYFDQAHLIHDFKSVLNITPKRYFENKEMTFDFYNYNRWRGDIFARDSINPVR